MASYKALSFAKVLADTLKARGQTIVESFDGSSNPMVKVGAAVLIRVINESTVQKNSIGLTQDVFTPHRVQVVFQGVTINGAGADTDPNTWAVKLAVLGEALATGALVEVYETASGNTVDETDFTSANLKASFGSLQYPLMNQQ